MERATGIIGQLFNVGKLLNNAQTPPERKEEITMTLPKDGIVQNEKLEKIKRYFNFPIWGRPISEADKELNEKPTIEEWAEEEIKVIDKLKEEIKNDNFWKVLDNAINTGFVEKMENGAYEWKGTERELAYFSESAYNNGFVKYKFSTIEKLFAKDKGCLTKSNWKSTEYIGAVKKGQDIDKLFII